MSNIQQPIQIFNVTNSEYYALVLFSNKVWNHYIILAPKHESMRIIINTLTAKISLVNTIKGFPTVKSVLCNSSFL
jgi:hypothetical protein